MWKVEDNLDICMSSTKETADKLELADKEAIDAELQVNIFIKFLSEHFILFRSVL